MAGRHGACRPSLAVPVLCVILIIVGMPLWVINSNTAASSTRSALTGANVGISASMVDYPLALLGIARLVLLVLAAVTAAGAAFLTALKACRGSRRRGSLGSAADGAMSGLVWLTMLAAVALFALYTTWLLSALAADMLLNTATQYSNTAERALNRAVGSANSLVDQLKQTQLAALDTAPADVKASPWFGQYRAGVESFNQTVASAAGTPTTTTCQPGCISLDFLAGLAGLDTTCICIQSTITAVQGHLQATKRATLMCLVGVLLVYLAASWLLPYFTASCVNARRDAREHRRLAKTSSTGEGLGAYGSSGGGGGGRPGAKLAPGTDAIMDVRAADSASARYKPAGTGLMAAQRAHPRPVHTAHAYVAPRPAVAAAATAADVGARDASRAQRLPLV